MVSILENAPLDKLSVCLFVCGFLYWCLSVFCLQPAHQPASPVVSQSASQLASQRASPTVQPASQSVSQSGV